MDSKYSHVVNVDFTRWVVTKFHDFYIGSTYYKVLLMFYLNE